MALTLSLQYSPVFSVIGRSLPLEWFPGIMGDEHGAVMDTISIMEQGRISILSSSENENENR